MTKRNFKQELCYSSYIDMEYGNNIETIDYESLIGVITELCDRIEKLEDKVDELSPNPTWRLD